MHTDDQAPDIIMVQPGGLRYDGVDSAYLDCFADNLAVLLRFHGVEDLRTPFAFQWYFDFDPGQNGALPSLQHMPVAEVLAWQTGCKLEHHPFEHGTLLQQCADLIHEGQPLLLFGDAYAMPWLPYAGHEHQEHTFIVDGISADHSALHIVDAYYNKTEWGTATPTDMLLHGALLEPIVGSPAALQAQPLVTLTRMASPATIDLAAVLRGNAEHILLQVGKKELLRRFSRHYAEHVADVAATKQFTIACWLIARTRTLHGLWLGQVASQRPDLVPVALAEQYANDVARAWQRVSEFAYILFRRISQGRGAPLSCFEMLEQTVHPAEVRVAEQLHASLRSN